MGEIKLPIFRTLAQISRYNENDVRTSKKNIGTKIEKLTIFNARGVEKFAGYCNISDMYLYILNRKLGTD